jgi:hypothetical protein
MADPSLALAFQDLILRVAEFLGIADYSGGVAGVPTDPHDLDLCKRLVNNGYRKFTNANPNWQAITPTLTITFSPIYRGTAQAATTTTITDTLLVQPAGVSFVGMTIGITGGTGINQSSTITGYNPATGVITFNAMAIAPDTTSQYSIAPATCVNGDNSRYFLPDNFYGQLVYPFTYDSVGPRIRIETIHEGRIRELLAGARYSGTPRLVAFRPLATSAASTGQRWEAIFYPAPNQAYNVTCRYRTYPAALTNLTDRHIFGFEYDEAVLLAALSEAEQQRNDTVGIQTQLYNEALQRALKIDGGSTPRRLGDYGDTSDDRLGVQGKRPLSFYSVDTYNGNSV